jgi:hypothetical protein
MRNALGALNEDPFASTVISQVANGAFGPRALAEYDTQSRASEKSSASDRTYHIGLSCCCVLNVCSGQRSLGAATNEWQLQIIQTMLANSRSGILPP